MTTAFAARNDINIKLIFNIRYRPDLMGIEHFWSYCKHKYRQQVDRFKTHANTWHNEAWVEELFTEHLSHQVAANCWAHGLKNVANALPVKPLHFEPEAGPVAPLRLYRIIKR